MSARGQLEQLQDNNNNNNMDLQKNNTRTEDDELTTVSDIRKETLEVLVIRTIQRVIGPIMEDLVRKVVKEQIESVQEDLMHRIQCNLSRQGNTSEPRSLRLMFSRNVNSPVLTSSKIIGEGGISINLALVDSLNGEVVKFGPEAAAEIEILVLKGDYGGHEGCNGKLEDFNNRIVSEMEGRKSILQGTTTLRLKEGISKIDDLSFTQNSRWMRKSKWCLGARAVNSFPGTTIEPAKTESFDLKDQRTKSYAKKEIPSLLDKVSRLKHIGKTVTKRLNDENIYTVKDFLVLLNTNPQRLHKILNVGSKAWEEVTDNAKTCIIDEEAVYMYIDPNSQQKCGVVYDVIGQVKGLLKESQYFPMNKLSDDEQKDAQKLVVCAFDQRENVSRYNDVNSLMECFPQTLGSTMTENLSELISSDFLFNGYEQAGIPSYNICTSIDCIGESSQLGSREQGLCGPIYSPPHFDEEILNFMTNSQPERLRLELKPKLSWFIICVSRWFMIRKRVRSYERDRVYKKQKIS